MQIKRRSLSKVKGWSLSRVEGYLFVAIFYTLSFSAQSERDIISLALSNNSDIKLVYSQMSYDSLSLAAVKSGWLPELLLTVNTPLTSTFKNGADPYGQIKSSIEVNQITPGGGKASASYNNDVNTVISMDSINHTNSFQLDFSQPILNGAWNYNVQKYAVTLQSLTNQQLTLESKKSILASLSAIRNLYWEYFAQTSYDSTYKRDLARASNFMQIVKSRFVIGEASVLDTLSASYDYTSAQQKLLDSKISAHRARNKLALALSLPPESLAIGDTLPSNIPDLPDPKTLISLTNQYDPSLKIFEKIAEQLVLSRQKTSNSLLPSLSAHASLSFDRSHLAALDTSDLTVKNAVIGLVFSYSLPPRKNLITKKQTTIKLQDNQISQQKYKDELTVKLDELIESWDQEKQRIALTEKSKQLAQLQFIAAEKEYKQGTIERLTLLDAQNKLVESELALTRIHIEMKKLEIILDEITGTLFQRFGIKN